MGRPHKDVTVLTAFDQSGRMVCEDIVANTNFAQSGSLLLNSAPVRKRDGIRMVSVRVFDPNGVRLSSYLKYFSREGASRSRRVERLGTNLVQERNVSDFGRAL